MKCPSCGKQISTKSKTCKYCRSRLIRKSDKMARKMTMNSRIAMASGGLLVLIAVILAINHTFIFAGVSFVVGAILIFIGKMMD